MAAKNPALSSEGFRCFAGPYTSNDEWMIDSVLRDAVKANKETRISDSEVGKWVWQRSRKRMAA
jgi:hypothetical protein